MTSTRPSVPIALTLKASELDTLVFGPLFGLVSSRCFFIFLSQLKLMCIHCCLAVSAQSPTPMADRFSRLENVRSSWQPEVLETVLVGQNGEVQPDGDYIDYNDWEDWEDSLQSLQASWSSFLSWTQSRHLVPPNRLTHELWLKHMDEFFQKEMNGHRTSRTPTQITAHEQSSTLRSFCSFAWRALRLS